MANDLTRKIMANIAAKSIPQSKSEGIYVKLAAKEEESLASVIYGGRKSSAPAQKKYGSGGISLADLAQQKRHG